MLKDFCTDPSKKDAILTEHDMMDGPGQRPGHKAAREKGSLAGMVIARYGTGEHTMTEGEVEELRAWFGRGGDREALAKE